MMRGASAPKKESKETLLKTKYKLDGSLPFDLMKWSNKKTARSAGGIPYEERGGDQMDNMTEDSFGADRAAISQVFQDERVNLQQREVIARSLLEGKYNIVGANDSGMAHETSMQSIEFDEHGRPVKPVYDQDIMRGTAQVNRARMRPLNFLEANGEQMDIILVDPRTVMEYEHTKNVERVKSPNKGKRGLYSWGGRTVAEEVLPIRVEIKKEEADRTRNSYMSTSKKTMYLDAKKRELDRTKEYLKWQKEAARRSKAKEGDRKADIQIRREGIRKFRGDLRKHLEASSNPMLGTIMRYVDDKVAWNIMNAYRGHAMSMDMVVGLIGQTLGTLETGAEEAKLAEHSNVTQGAEGGNIGMPSSFITEVETSEEALNLAVNPPPPLVEDPSLVEAENKATDFDDSVVSVNEAPIIDDEVHVKGIVDKGDFLKPYSAGHKSKFIAKENLFAPHGLKKKGPQELPYTDEIAKYALSSRPGTGTATSKEGGAGSPEGSRRPGTGSKRSGGAIDEKKERKAHERKQHWNSETEGDMRHPYDRIQIERQSGEIKNISAWYSTSNPGARTNTPSESGHKGWNAGEVTMKKTAAGFMAKLDGQNSPEKNIVDEIFAGDDAFRQSMQAASQSLHFASMQSFIDESKAVTNPGDIFDTTVSVDDSTAAHTQADIEQEWEHVRPLADAIEQEKIALGTIPKYQPEKILSDEQLSQLGEKQISFDTIAAQMRWAKQKKVRQLEEQRKLGETADFSAVGTRMQTSQSLGDLNAMTTDLDPKGGVSIKTNEFTNMDVEMGFRPMPERGSHEDIGINPDPGAGARAAQLPSLAKSGSMESLAKSGSLFSLENPKEIQRLLDSNICAPPKQLKTSLSKMPESPFKTYEARMKVIQSGVSSSAGLGLWLSEQERAARLAKWGPRSKSREGRFRVGHSSNGTSDSGFSPTKEEVNTRKKKFGQLLP